MTPRRHRKRYRKPRPHDLRGEYARIPRNAKLAVVDIDDPYGVPPGQEASLELPEYVRRRNGAAGSDQVREWQAPQMPRLRVIASLRDDVLARMYARRQIDEAQFRAGREYQALAEMAQISHVASQALARLSRIDAGNSGSSLTDSQRRARVRLARADARLLDRFGLEGVALLRAVLISGRSLGQAARDRGSRSQRAIDFWALFFRRMLSELAVVLGYATATAYRDRRAAYGKVHKPIDPSGKA